MISNRFSSGLLKENKTPVLLEDHYCPGHSRKLLFVNLNIAAALWEACCFVHLGPWASRAPRERWSFRRSSVLFINTCHCLLIIDVCSWNRKWNKIAELVSVNIFECFCHVYLFTSAIGVHTHAHTHSCCAHIFKSRSNHVCNFFLHLFFCNKHVLSQKSCFFLMAAYFKFIARPYLNI